MINKSSYNFSYTAASLRLSEMISIAKYYYQNPTDDLRTMIRANQLLGTMKGASVMRISNELSYRIEILTSSQIELLANGDLNTQKQIALLAICKFYKFIHDFIIEVVREKTLVYDYQIYESDYNIFFKSKSDLCIELDEYTDSTKRKARNVLFLILEESGLIDNRHDKNIQHQILNPEVIRVIAEDNPEYLKLFLMPDADINTYR